MSGRPDRLALWAGAECTVNRVGDSFSDQVEATGFEHRLDDLDRLASLGIQRLRFPLLWERVAPLDPLQFNWEWSDSRLQRLQALGVEPIAGLVHHGSGPRYTDLLDPQFPHQLAAYARAVAERYPGLVAYTPINEPVTTARFSTLYAHWYPHHRSDASFVRAVLNQVEGTVAAMRAIRTVNPAAELVQTDDLGFTFSTPAMADRAAFYNDRRWLGYDLLCGRVDRDHPLWDYLRAHGASEAELMALVEQPCTPQVIGINSYVTSERFLDERIHRYPAGCHTDDGGVRHVDTEAVRVLGSGIGGFAARLAEAHERYHLPLAITEVHLGCTRDEQLRWLHQAWREAEAARRQGADVRAVTAWSAFGSVDWNTLLTERNGHYEPGLWDVRSPAPRETALAKLARALARGEDPCEAPSQDRVRTARTDAKSGKPFTEPASPAAPEDNAYLALRAVLQGPGWWLRTLRLHHPVHGEAVERPGGHDERDMPPLLITGATGTLGRAFAGACAHRGLPHRLLDRSQLDIANPASVAAALDHWQPWAVVNTAGFVRVDEAEQEAHRERHWRENAIGPAVLAEACARFDLPLLTFSSDLVFDGERDEPYAEHDQPRPLNAYGRAKHAAERAVLQQHARGLVVRTAAFFGAGDAHNFIAQGLQRLRAGEPWLAAEDQTVSPTHVPDLVDACLDLLIDGETGIWHLAGDTALSWADFARRAALASGLPVAGVQGVTGVATPAPRPRFSALRSERGRLMPTLDEALQRCVAELDRRARSGA